MAQNINPWILSHKRKNPQFKLYPHLVLCPLHADTFKHSYVGQEVRIIEVLRFFGTGSDAGVTFDAYAAHGDAVVIDSTHGTRAYAEPAEIAMIQMSLGLRLKEPGRRSVLFQRFIVFSDISHLRFRQIIRGFRLFNYRNHLFCQRIHLSPVVSVGSGF